MRTMRLTRSRRCKFGFFFRAFVAFALLGATSSAFASEPPSDEPIEFDEFEQNEESDDEEEREQSLFGSLLRSAAEAINPIKERVATEDEFFWQDAEDGSGVVLARVKDSSEFVDEVVLPRRIGGKDVVEIGAGAFGGCSSLLRLTLPEGVKKIGPNAFSLCRYLFFVELPDGLETIDEVAFANCASLTRLTLPESLTTIGDCAFFACPSLEEIVASPKSAHFKNIKGALFSKNGDVLIAVPAGRRVQTFVAPDGVKEIANGAFHSCRFLKTAKLPEGLEKIGALAFADCASLSKLVLPESLKSIGYCAFQNCRSLESVELPETLEVVGLRAFSNCASLTSATIPERVKEIGASAFDGCLALKEIKTSPKNLWFKEIDGVLFSKSGDLLVAYPPGRAEEAYVVPEGVERIGEGAFGGATALKNATLSETLKEIGLCAFSRCSSLETLTIPEGVEKIESGAFSLCKSLETVDLPKSLEEIGEDAFGFAPDCVFRVVSGSYAERWARENGFRFATRGK